MNAEHDPPTLDERIQALARYYLSEPRHYEKAIKKIAYGEDASNLTRSLLNLLFREFLPVIHFSRRHSFIQKDIERRLGGQLFSSLYGFVLAEIHSAARKKVEETENLE